MDEIDGFLLTRHWRDTQDGLELSLWISSEKGPVHLRIRGQSAVFFLPRDEKIVLPATATRRPVNLRSIDDLTAVDAIYFARQGDLRQCRDALQAQGGRCFEADLKPVDRFLMERFVTAGLRARGHLQRRNGYLEMENPSVKRAESPPNLRLLSIDIETDGLEGALFSIAASDGQSEVVFLVDSQLATDPSLAKGFELKVYPDEAQTLSAFFAWLQTLDPDGLIGWNVINFDLDFLEQRARRHNLAFAIGRGGQGATILPAGSTGVRVARIPGRVVLDGIETLRSAFISFESYALESVAQAILGRGKQIDEVEDRVASIRKLYAEDKIGLCQYNIGDCRLVLDIFAEKALLSFAARRAELTGLAIDRMGGSVAAFDNLYLPRLHRKGLVGLNVADVKSGVASPGGYVLDSKPGLYKTVLLLDFKSLYPSIIRTFAIDPAGLSVPGADAVPGFLGARFARQGGILPGLITELWAARDVAKRSNDASMSQAVKILMNSFYGVLGASGCRFFDPRLASSITRRGHEIIRRSREWIEERGHEVIYGDTDSLFVHVATNDDLEQAQAIGESLARGLNIWWRERIEAEFSCESALEIEFETLFERFLMPTVRGEETGSKKRYAGLCRNSAGEATLVFKGLESVRTDWTPIARNFQRELYRRIFFDEPFEAFVRDTAQRMEAGLMDADLIYRKRLRRALKDYTQNVPPHVQAARKQKRPGRWVRYVITSNGPEPVESKDIPTPDYDHYRERQLAPVADGILHFLDTSFERIAGAQLEIF